MARPNLTYGTSHNGIPYVRFGHGPQTLLLFAGGLGNQVPRGAGAAGFTRGLRALTSAR